MVELTVEKILLIGIGLIFALVIGIPLVTNLLEIIKISIHSLG
ncbi:MAG: hypothetical protein ACTSO9_17980 [Candidatus Helarchaeota archaeon]